MQQVELQRRINEMTPESRQEYYKKEDDQKKKIGT